MDNWGIDKLIEDGGVMIFEGGNTMTKKEQLKMAFKRILNLHYIDCDGSINIVVEELLKEVSIRVPLK